MWKHGMFYWNELMTRDAARAKAFYGATLGWSYEAMPMEGGVYWVAKIDGEAVGGVFTMQGSEFDGLPEHWFAYVAVDDVDARLAGVPKVGGTVIRPPFDIPGVGRIAIVQDATGAVIGWITPAPMEVDGGEPV